MIRFRSRGSWIFWAALALTQTTLIWSTLFFSGASCTGATKCMAGVSLNGHVPARLVGPRRRNCNAAHSFVRSSCIWSYWECLMRRAATDVPMSTSIILRNNGGTINQSHCCMLPASPCTHRTWRLLKTGVDTGILRWRISSGLPGPLAGMPAAPELWTQWTSWTMCPLRKGRTLHCIAGQDPSGLITCLQNYRWKLCMHLTRVLCAGRRFRRWRHKPQAHSRRKCRRQPRTTCNTLIIRNGYAQVWRLLLAGLRQLLLRRPLDDRCALVTSVPSRLVQACCQSSVKTCHERRLQVQCLLIICSSPQDWVSGLRLPPRNPADAPSEVEVVHAPLPLKLSFRLIGVRPCLPCIRHRGSAALCLPGSGGPTASPGPSTMDRDPLHDSILDAAEADAEASDASSATPMTRAERADGMPPPTGPGPHGPPIPTPVQLFMASGPPAPLPYSQEVATQTSLRLLRSSRHTTSAGTSASTGSSLPPPTAHTEPLTGWQRDLALHVIEQLHLTSPVYLQAPSLAELWSWRAITLTLSPTLPDDEQEHRRVDATDVGGHLWETWETAEERGHIEHLDSDPSNSDPDPVVDPSLDTAGATSDGPAYAPGPGYGCDAELHPAPGASSAGSRSDPGPDSAMLYEEGGIVFDLGAAQDCLRTTRETLHMFREDHARSRSRSRDAAPGSGSRRVMAATTFLTSLPEPYASPHCVPPPAIRFAGLWLLIRIAYWAGFRLFRCHRSVYPCPFQGDEIWKQSAPRATSEPLSELQTLALGWDSHCHCTADPGLSAAMICTTLPPDEKTRMPCPTDAKNCQASPATMLPHLQLCTRYEAAAVCSSWDSHAVCPATSSYALLCAKPLRVCCYNFCTHCAVYILVAIQYSAKCLHRPLTRWAGAVNRGQASEAPCSHISHSRLSPLLCLTSLSGRRSTLTAHSSELTTKSRLGPKSRGPHKCLLLLCLLHYQIQQAAAVGLEARVVNPATGFAEGETILRPLSNSAPKPSGIPSQSPMPRAPVSRYVKRSYKRACQRALTQGRTTYRGRLLEAHQVPDSLRSTPHIQAQPRKAPPAMRQGLHVFCWNAGGLGGGLYAELLTFLTNSTYDVAIILESKWQECLEFTTGPWSCIHSGCKSRKQAGVLILIHQRITQPSRIRFEHVLQGRLLHVRVPLPGRDARHLHILGIYQKTYDPKCSSMLEQRLQVWQALERCLNRIPVRDSLMVAGDFNTPLQPAPPFVGGVTSPLPCHPPEDMEDLAQLMRTYGLVALNTWRRHPPQAKATTFRFGNTESQIDFLLVRRREATMQAKQAHPIRHFHVGASRQSGAIHFPLITVLQLRCPHWVMRPAKSPPQISVDSVLQALDYPTVPDHMLRIAQVRQAISHHMATVGGVAGVEQLHAVLFQACCQAFPKPQATPTEKPWQSQPVQLSVKELWARWRAFKQVRKNGLRGWFQAWRAWKNFDKQHREHQRRCKQARRAKLLTAMQEAQACAYKHDTRGLYQIVKRIAPKQAYRRLQLRDDRGLMLTPAEEADSLQMHFRTRFQAELPAPSNAETTQQQDAITGPWLLAAPPQLDAVALCLELQAIPRRKAVPAGHPPGAAWRLCADMVSTWICPLSPLQFPKAGPTSTSP